jgi:hypothetical protein
VDRDVLAAKIIAMLDGLQLQRRLDPNGMNMAQPSPTTSTACAIGAHRSDPPTTG